MIIDVSNNQYLKLENFYSISTEYDIDFLDESLDPDEGYGNELRPVFVYLMYSDSTFDHIVEKFVKGQNYWHAALSFGPALSQCYSFNFGAHDANMIKGGLSVETLDEYIEDSPNADIEVSCILLNTHDFRKVKDTVNWYMKNKQKTYYDFYNLWRSFVGKATKDGIKKNLVCSTFVDTILKAAGVDITHKNSNLVKPDDLMRNDANKRKYFKLYQGKIGDYNIDKITMAVDKLSRNPKNDFMK